MGKALIIGCGGVGSVAIHKCVENSEIFNEICIASRNIEKCNAIKSKLDGKTTTRISTAQVDANDVGALVNLIEIFNPDVVVNLALPYHDLKIMEACLKTKTNYLDTANYEPEETAYFEYKHQWALDEDFKRAGITALLGCGFDPGVTGIFTAYALKHYFDKIFSAKSLPKFEIFSIGAVAESLTIFLPSSEATTARAEILFSSASAKIPTGI